MNEYFVVLYSYVKKLPVNFSDLYAAIVYQIDNGDLHEGVMMTNVETFIFKEIFFGKKQKTNAIINSTKNGDDETNS